MANQVRSMVVGVFERRDQAQCALEGLRRAGFKDDQLGMAMRNEEGMAPDVKDTKAGEGAVTGAVTGGILGGLLGAAVSLLVPGIGPILAAGVLATTLAGVAGGVVAGGLIGGLVGMGVPEDEARFYDQEFQAGRVIVTANAGDRYDEAFNILRDCGAYDMNSRPSQTTGAYPYQSLEGNPPTSPSPQTFEGNPRNPRPQQTYEGYIPNSQSGVPGRTNPEAQEPGRLYGTGPEPQARPDTVYGTEPEPEPSDTVYGTEPDLEKSETVYGTGAPIEAQDQTDTRDAEVPVAGEEVIVERRMEVDVDDEDDDETG